MKARLLEICDRENMEDRNAIVDDVLRHSMGDMRKAVTTLQSLSTIPGANVREMAGTIPNDVVDAVWQCMTTSKRFDTMAAQVEDLVTHAGYSAQTLLPCLLDKLLLDDDEDNDQKTTTKLSEVAKASIAIRLAEAEKNMIEGADEYLQLLTVGSMVFEATMLLKASNG
jgi:replication factor C subunit 2/4